MLRTLRHPSTLLLGLCLSWLPHSALGQQPFTATTTSALELPAVIPTPRAPVQPAPASLTSFVTDQDGDFIPGATITLSRPEESTTNDPQTISRGDGSFSLTNIEPGSFQLTISALGFTTRQTTLSLQPGQQAEIDPIALTASANINIEVTASQHDIAEAQVAIAEKQRILGVVPNFYVSYDANPVPLVAKQKFQMAGKMNVDPVNFLMVGVIAGFEQSQNTFAGYGQGLQGYAKRYGATYANGFTTI